MERLKETLSIDEIEEGEHEARWQFRTFEDLEHAQEYAKEKSGYLYTQVDSEVSDDRIYVRGNRLVNRTGTWAVVTEPDPLAWATLQMFKSYIEQMLPAEGGFPMEDGEVERQLRLFDRFLTELEKTYEDCSECQHKIAPNETYFIGDEEKRCEECGVRG